MSILSILNMGIFPCLEARYGHICNMTRSYIAFTVQKRELTLENPFLYWKGLSVVRPHLEYAVTVCTPLYKKIW